MRGREMRETRVLRDLTESAAQRSYLARSIRTRRQQGEQRTMS
jgi:hypothetical protein